MESKEEKKEAKGKVEEEEENPEDRFDELLIKDLFRLQNNKKLSDVVFIVGSDKEQIFAHKFILAAASEVFAAMVYPNPAFKDLKPASQQITVDIGNGQSKKMLAITLPTTNPDLFRQMLDAVYTNQADVDLEEVSEGLKLAQKYNLEKFRQLCAKQLDQGLTVENCCSMFANGAAIAGDSNFGLEFIAEHAKEVFESQGFLELSKERVSVLLENNYLKIREVDLFKAVVEWGKREVKRQDKKTESKDDLKNALADLIPLVRFPLMKLQDFSATVTPTGLLEQKAQLAMFAYLAAKDKGTTLPSVPFSTEPRGAAAFDFKWQRCGTRGSLTEGNMTFNTNSSGYCIALGDKVMKRNSGTYYWEIKVLNMNSGDWQFAVGVGTQSVDVNSHMAASGNGWGFFSNGYRANNSGSTNDRFGESYTTGDTIGVLYDSDKGHVSYFRNRRSLGICFTNVTQDVFPAVQLNTSGRCTIVPGATVPQ